MAKHQLLAAFCILVVIYATSSVEGCRIKSCVRYCTNVLGRPRWECLRACARQARVCKVCVGPYKCLRCKPGYIRIGFKCYPCPLGCRCIEPNICQSCLTGYSMATSGVCKACPAVCDSCDSTGKCTCKSGYIASGSYDPTKPTTTGPPCLACSANCAVCQQNGPGQCDTCKKGFLETPVNGVCQACGANCQACTSAGSCDTCSPGYKLISSSAQRTCAACPAHCSSCDTFGTSICDTCMDGYGLSSDHKSCIACADNCASCHTAGYGKCDPVQCLAGTFTTDGSQTCGLTSSDIPQNCDVATSTAVCKYCTTANNFWETATPSCVAAATSASDAKCLFWGYVKTAANCLKCDDTSLSGSATCVGLKSACTPAQLVLYPNCKECSGTGSDPLCVECNRGYHTNADGSCTPCIANCVVCESSATTCDLCADTYNLRADKKLCSKCHPGCGTADCATTGGCDSYCIDGYKLDSATGCAPCAPGCNSCLINGKDKCDDQQCKTGYTLTAEGKCAKA